MVIIFLEYGFPTGFCQNGPASGNSEYQNYLQELVQHYMFESE